MGQLARNEMTYERYYTFDDVMKQINNVTMNDFNRVCHRMLKDKRLTVVSLGKLKDIDENPLDFLI
jgi:predicted Zn-dependent peptidase